MARIVVSGWVTGLPTASFFWHAVSFAVGFRDAGHDAWFLEDSGDYPWSYDPETGEMDPSATYGRRFLAAEMARIGLADRWAFRHCPSGSCYGLTEEALGEVLDTADVLVNVSLTTPPRPEYRRIPHRLGIDTDPVFTQVRIANGDQRLDWVPDWHTRLFTFGRPPLPGQRHEWLPTRQPVATRFWPVAPHPGAEAPFTTIMSWQSYPPVTLDGFAYGAKDFSMRELLDLPARSRARLAVALGAGNHQGRGAAVLEEHGWSLTNPLVANRSTPAFHRFLRESAGEIGIVKHGYVAARSGWFSERTCCYLASGRPAVVADTGWPAWLPEGEGLLAYRTVEEAAAALEQVRADPERHARAARKLVTEHFEAADVCAALLKRL
ncbi:MAG: glycosyltransferase [Mycobacteriales bacterium]